MHYNVKMARMFADVSLKAVVAEFIATAILVFIGCGTAVTFAATQGPNGFTLGVPSRGTGNVGEDMLTLTNSIKTNGSWGVATALAFGLAITVLVFVTSHLSGGQVNPAVTLGLVCSGALSLVQGLMNTAAQLVGGIFGAAFLRAVIPGSSSSTLGANEVAPGVSQGNALCGELVMTFVLVLTVLETAVNKLSKASNNAPLAIGFAVYCAHAVLLPIDGCCINPARFLGPALVAGKSWFSNSWVFVVGPYLGALFAVPFHLLFRSRWGMSRAQREPFDEQETVPEIESQLHPRDMGKAPQP